MYVYVSALLQKIGDTFSLDADLGAAPVATLGVVPVNRKREMAGERERERERGRKGGGMEERQLDGNTSHDATVACCGRDVAWRVEGPGAGEPGSRERHPLHHPRGIQHSFLSAPVSATKQQDNALQPRHTSETSERWRAMCTPCMHSGSTARHTAGGRSRLYRATARATCPRVPSHDRSKHRNPLNASPASSFFFPGPEP